MNKRVPLSTVAGMRAGADDGGWTWACRTGSRPRSRHCVELSKQTSCHFSSLRVTVDANAGSAVTIYVESLDLSRFSGPRYEETLEQHLRVGALPEDTAIVYSVRSRLQPGSQ
jgi:hypothetical protein